MVALNEFADVFNTLAKDVVAEVEQLQFPAEAVEYLNRMVNYNVPGGKRARIHPHMQEK